MRTWLENGAGLAGCWDYSGDTHSPPTSLLWEWKSTHEGPRLGTFALCNITERTFLASVATVINAHMTWWQYTLFYEFCVSVCLGSDNPNNKLLRILPNVK